MFDCDFVEPRTKYGLSQPEGSLPRPDMVCFMDVSKEVAMKRANKNKTLYFLQFLNLKKRNYHWIFTCGLKDNNLFLNPGAEDLYWHLGWGGGGFMM